MSTSRRKKLEREAKLKEQSKELKRQKKLASTKSSLKVFKPYSPKKVYLRETQEVKSFSGKSKGLTNKKETFEYSGDYITGLATMHKSNIVPVGKDCDPTIYAQMRRN